MRLQRYIIEENELTILNHPIRYGSKLYRDTMTDIVSILKRDCGPYIKELKDKFIYRGYSHNINNIKRIKTRVDRRPMDSPQRLHDLMDGYFKKNFGWKARSKGVFTSADLDFVKGYGQACIFFPIGEYKYLYRKGVNDSLNAFMDIIRDLYGFNTRLRNLTDELLDGAFVYYRKKSLDKYVSKGLNNIYDEEVIFKCKEYYLLNCNSIGRDDLSGMLWHNKYLKEII